MVTDGLSRFEPRHSPVRAGVGSGVERERDSEAQPLLMQESDAGWDDLAPELLQFGNGAEPRAERRQATLLQSTMNMVNTIVGAGMMALPMGFAVLGIAGGLLSFTFVIWIMRESIQILVKISWQGNHTTYGGLVEAYMGRAGAALIRISLVFTCLGFLISYIIIIGDLLIGQAPAYNGILPSMLGHVPGTQLPWVIQRGPVVALISAIAILPLTCLRSLERLSSASILKCLVSSVFASVTVWAAASAAAKGELPETRWWPDFKAISSEGILAITRFVAVIPVVLTAYSCHFNIHPTMQELEDATPWRMMLLISNSLVASSAIFVVVGISGYVSFGANVQADVLENYSIDFLEPVFGTHLAMVVNYVLKLGFLCLLLCTYPLLNWPFRENLLEMGGVQASSLGHVSFCLVSAALLAGVYAIAMGIPTIWTALSLMGSTSAVMVTFVFPGIIQCLCAEHLMDMEGEIGSNGLLQQVRHRKAMGAFLVAIGAAVGGAGIYNTASQAL